MGRSEAVPRLATCISASPASLSSSPDRAADILQRQLQDALGVRVVAGTDPSGYAFIAFGLTRNIDGASDGVVPFTFGF